LVNFGVFCNVRCLYILWPFGLLKIFCGILVYLWSFGIFYVHYGHLVMLW
jgi:hypothetical protein